MADQREIEFVKVNPDVYLDHRQGWWKEDETRGVVVICRDPDTIGPLFVLIDRWKAPEIAESLKEHWLVPVFRSRA